ncbi:protein mono-ADP-ribosyltransferase PARP14-like [Girardinichthys multiradiatus]|uniref:protein mono-ADP-ribosyltransferase PARP14-like n=1 Tax=Girardinichthys multiradiatus TaxID=208333 RepID=UPI001FAD1A30|nr:protein mono-ADP-ribosyltransferase PARP14-like [Girardinichthys multiradiatus]
MDVLNQGAASGASIKAGVQVEIVHGTIENQQVDALVSPMVGHDPLSTRIGKTLSNMTGGQLEAKFHKEAGGATLPSESVVVKGLPGLKCKAVFFLNLLCWDCDQHGSAAQTLRQGIKKILAICDIRAYSSLALPVLGTGALMRFPHNITSTILLEEVGVYGQNRASRSPFLVRIIVHPKDKESNQAFRSAQGVLHQRGFISNVNPGFFYQCVSVTNDEITTMMGGVKLQIVCGDIINAGTDVIVNTTNFKNLCAGVSKAILTAAGPAVHAELTQVGIPADFICTTAAGQLGCKEIIHASFKRKAERIRNTCKKILQFCESKRFESVAFPAINTGQAGLNSGEACKAMLDGMASGIREINPNSLSLIRIVILKQRVFQAFRSELESRCQQDGQSCLSLKGIAKGTMKKILEMNFGISMSPTPQDQTLFLPNSGATELQEIHCGLNVTKTTEETLHQELSEGKDKEKAISALTTKWAIENENGEMQELCLLDKEAHPKKEDFVDMLIQDGRMFKVNLKAGEATECLTGKTYKLKSIATETGCAAPLALELPPHWEPMKGEIFKKVELQPNSPEYQKVAKGFHKTTQYNIQKIEKVQNVYLWHAFSICRYRILSKNGEAELGEKLLYHGTSAASCNSIERDRFDRSYAGKHAAIYGKGVYFAVNASYSADKFSPADKSGLKRLYVARVLTGRYTVGHRAMKTPPPRGAEAADCFDSLVDNQQQPAIFVIFHDDQAYPEYLITFS